MSKGFKDYLAEADAVVETCSVQDALRLHARDEWVFVDVRDGNELQKEGKIPGAVHASRGFLEFRIDPTSPMHDQALAPGADKRFVFYCGTGDAPPWPRCVRSKWASGKWSVWLVDSTPGKRRAGRSKSDPGLRECLPIWPAGRHGSHSIAMSFVTPPPCL